MIALPLFQNGQMSVPGLVARAQALNVERHRLQMRGLRETAKALGVEEDAWWRLARRAMIRAKGGQP